MPSVLLMIILLGSLLLGSTINWVSVYLAVELQTLALFVLYYVRVELILINVFNSKNFRNVPPTRTGCDGHVHIYGYGDILRH